MAKVVFTYSWVYDQNWKKWSTLYPYLADKKYPSFERIEKEIKKMEKVWLKYEKPVLREIEKITGLKWTEKEIKCYIVGLARGFSDPLTLSIEKDPKDFIDTLVHELLHQIFAVQKGNMQRCTKAWKYIYKAYTKETHSTKVHIPVHAVHKHLYLKFFNEKRMGRDIAICKKLPDYQRSWKIVEEDGYESIIKEFASRIKK